MEADHPTKRLRARVAARGIAACSSHVSAPRRRGHVAFQVLQWRSSFAPPRRPGASGPWRTPRSLRRAR
eukprot:6901195-Prymnesium_polylepis.1